ncbi:hypothetical protein Prum_077690 [Phytohabitans rumicis]|uniref:Uncharacterized protein n=1 Tax=Phytohabitans rumicis TaxID=1076125 RepID=A0A6V8LJ88_9ACTN|nr:hypothetical protein Prum_077690 [Phytohabitans rumicis]
MVGQAVRQFGALGVHGYPAGEVFEPAGVVDVQVADGYGVHLGDVDAGGGQGLFEGLAGAGEHRLVIRAGVEPPA